jgi:putative inorganic carbon (HCO3(-)) transporter
MPENRERYLFALTLSSAAAVLVSIAAAETLLAITCLVWIVVRPRPFVWPSYFTPLCAFMVTTAFSLAMSPEPAFGRAAIYKFWLFSMGLLAANFINTPWRARFSHALLLTFAAATSILGLVQFARGYLHYQSTQTLADDPMVLKRITGFMGHWITYSDEQLLVWCAAIPAIVILGRRWMIPLGLVAASLVLGFTRSVWLGAMAGFVVAAVIIPRKVLIGVALPVAIIGASASGLIYHRISMSLSQPDFAPDTGRVKLAVAGVQMIQAHPLFGVGPQRIHTEFPNYYHGREFPSYYGHLENNVLQLAAERGLLCLAAFFWFIFDLYASLISIVRRDPDEVRWPAVSALAALTGFLIAGLFEYNFGDSEVLLLLLFIVSVPFGLKGTANRIAPKQTAPRKTFTDVEIVARSASD